MHFSLICFFCFDVRGRVKYSTFVVLLKMAKRGRVGSDLVYVYMSWSLREMTEIDIVKRAMQADADAKSKRVRVTRSEAVRHMWDKHVSPVIQKKIENSKRAKVVDKNPPAQNSESNVPKEVGATGINAQGQKLPLMPGGGEGESGESQ